MELLLISLQRDRVVGALLHDLLHDLPLTPHRVDGDDGALQFEQIEQLWNRRDLVRLFGRRDLAEQHPVLRSPRVHEMQRRAPGRAVERSSQGLAVDRDEHAINGSGERSHPRDEAVSERLRVEPDEHPAEGVVARRPARQFEELAERGLVRAGVHLHVVPTLRTADHGQDRDGHDVEQEMGTSALDARIRQ